MYYMQIKVRLRDLREFGDLLLGARTKQLAVRGPQDIATSQSL